MFNIRIIAVLCCSTTLALFKESNSDNDFGETVFEPPILPRRQEYIPVHYATGSHYEVGYSVGRVYGLMMRQFVDAYSPLIDQLKAYNTDIGREIYTESLEATKKFFPQYVSEMHGMADGSGVPFHKLFLMTLDDTLLLNVNNTTTDKGPIGCTSILVNQITAQLLGHTEDAVIETVNNFILLVAHVIPSTAEMGGIYPAREEKFKALTYIGHVSGYASGFNHHGVLFSVNTIFASKPLRGRISREFLCRASLSSRADLKEFLSILANERCGTADAFNVNLVFLNESKGERMLYTIEVVPNPNDLSSIVALTSFPLGNNSLHTNRLLHADYPELNQDGYIGSKIREERYKILTSAMPNSMITNVGQLLTVLGNQDDMSVYPMFGDNDTAKVNTIHLGIFDLEQKTWTMWCNDPFKSPPLLQLSLTFSDLISPIRDDLIVENVQGVIPFTLDGRGN